MTEIILVRHAENEWVKTGKLAGRLPGVHLNEYGRAQAQALGERLSKVSLQAIYSSPMERTIETAQAIAAHHPGLTIQTLDEVNEVQFGVWEGQEIKTLAQRKMWRVVQVLPSRARFPEGETFRQAQMRAVDAVESVAGAHPRERVVVVSHSDIIRLVVAHYLGVHLDHFQRITISPASMTTIHLGHMRPMIMRVNDDSHCPPPPKEENERSD
ncbi:MAG: MSMEG_4193 family putative phosphomutase [Anaerolineae bacterium]|nr:MSMEG_4193 family putative phosphomutase [Anaerolineae bacterium]